MATGATTTNSDAQVIIQAVYDLVAADSTKNRVFQGNGTYDIDATLTAPSYLIHEGQGWNTLIRGLATITGGGIIRNSDQTNGNVEITLSNLKIDQHLAGTPSTGACVHFQKVHQSKIEKCYFLSKQMYGLWFAGANTPIYDNHILYNYFTGTGANDPLGGGSLTHSWVIGNTFCNATAGGGGIMSQRKAERTIFAFNHAYGSASSGMNFESCIRCIIYGNHCYDNDHMGLKSLWTTDTGGSGGSPTNLIVANNYCYSNGQRGIQLEGGGHLVIGNYCSDNELSGIEIVDNGGDSAAVINDYIAFNTCLNNGKNTASTPDTRRCAIRVVGSGQLITNNYCTDTQGTKTQVSGIDEVGTANNNIIKNNYVAGNLTRGLSKVGAATKVKFNDGYVTENEGATSIADGGTISHGLATTPTVATVSTRTAGEFASVTARSTTTITVAIKKWTGGTLTAGTTQIIDWRATI